MAVDKLVDSAQLDADLTSVANAIRTKGGTSAQMAFPAGFVQAIGDISVGGKQTLYMKSNSSTQLANLTGAINGIDIDEIIVDANHLKRIGAFSYLGIESNPKIKFINAENNTYLGDSFRGACTFREIDLGGMAPATISRCLYQGDATPGSYYPSEMLVKNLDLSNVTGAADFAVFRQTELTVLFSGVLHIDFTYSNTAITVESIISLISCLEDLTGTGTTHTLTLGANKDKLTAAQIAVATDKGWTVA